MNTFAFLVNFGNSIFYIYTLHFDYELTQKIKFLPIKGVYLSKLVWLTLVCFTCLTIYHSIGAVLAFLNPRKHPKLFRRFHFAATSVLHPLSLQVCALFWILYLYDPKMLADRPEIARVYIEHPWFNHALHTTPLIGMTVDALVWRHPRPSKKSALKVIFFFISAYIGVVHLVHYISGFWAYPILGNLNVIERAAFILVCALVLFASFFITDSFNSFLQSKSKVQHKKH